MNFLNNKLYSNYLFISTFVFFTIYFLSFCLAPVHAQGNLTVIPKDSSPFGKPYSNWTAEWWQWYVETPFDNNHPSRDLTGVNCGINQSGPVWFISGSEKVPIEKTCVVPEGKAILVPILIYECSYTENKNEKTPEDLLNCAKSNADNMQALKLRYGEIDLPEQQIRQEFRISTSPFIVNFPENNVFLAQPPGPTTAVSDGYWIMFEPPSPGNYDINFGGCFGNPIVVDPAKFCQDVTYHLKVLPS
jgi:hypothetical protein